MIARAPAVDHLDTRVRETGAGRASLWRSVSQLRRSCAHPVTLGDHALAFDVSHGRGCASRPAGPAVESHAPGICRDLQLAGGSGGQQGQRTGDLPVSDRSIDWEAVAARSDPKWLESLLPRFGPF